MKKIVLLAVAVVIFGALFFGLSKTQKSEESVSVAATIFPLYDIVKNIAGGSLEVKLLLPPGASPHFFEFSPLQLRQLQGVKTIFAIGYGLDDWALKAKEAISGSEVYVVDKGLDLRESVEEDHEEGEDEHEEGEEEEHGHGPIDPHYWLSFSNAKLIAQNVAQKLSEIDPENSEKYLVRAKGYVALLEKTEGELKAEAASLAGKKIITLHDAMYYFADNFGLNIVATFEPSAGQDPTPQYLANLGKTIKEHGVKVLFTETQLGSLSLEAFARENSLKIAGLDEVGGSDGRQTYIDLMRYNVNAVLEAFR